MAERPVPTDVQNQVDHFKTLAENLAGKPIKEGQVDGVQYILAFYKENRVARLFPVVKDNLTAHVIPNLYTIFTTSFEKTELLVIKMEEAAIQFTTITAGIGGWDTDVEKDGLVYGFEEMPKVFRQAGKVLKNFQDTKSKYNSVTVADTYLDLHNNFRPGVFDGRSQMEE